MMRLFAVILLLIACPAAVGQSVKLPAEVKAKPGQWIVISPEIDGGKPKYALPAGVVLVDLTGIIPKELLDKSTGIVVVADKAGRYPVQAWNAKADVASDLATCVLVVGDAPPVPPDPPTPPTDPLTKELQAAYNADANPIKAEQLNQLQGLYRAFQKSVKNESLATIRLMFDLLSAARKELLGDEALIGVRQVIQADFEKHLPTDGNVQITPEVRKLLVSEFAKISKALDGVK